MMFFQGFQDDYIGVFSEVLGLFLNQLLLINDLELNRMLLHQITHYDGLMGYLKILKVYLVYSLIYLVM